MKKEYRIKKNEEFSSIIHKKHSHASGVFIVYYEPRKLDHARIGISVSKKLGDAHVRNKIKRQLRMMLLDVVDFKEEIYDMIVIVRPKYLENAFLENKKDLEKMLKQVKIKEHVKRGKQ